MWRVEYNCFFCGNRPSNDAQMWRHFVGSLKNKDEGYCGRTDSPSLRKASRSDPCILQITCAVMVQKRHNWNFTLSLTDIIVSPIIQFQFINYWRFNVSKDALIPYECTDVFWWDTILFVFTFRIKIWQRGGRTCARFCLNFDVKSKN